VDEGMAIEGVLVSSDGMPTSENPAPELLPEELRE
jgi:hypothetical protein